MINGNLSGKGLMFTSRSRKHRGVFSKCLWISLFALFMATPVVGQGHQPEAAQPSNASGMLARLWRHLPFRSAPDAPAATRQTIPLARLSPSLRDARICGDLQAATHYRERIITLLQYLRNHPEGDLTPPAVNLTGGPAAPQEAPLAWQSFLDTFLALDAIARYHHDFMALKGNTRAASFQVFQAALVAENRAACECLEILRGQPVLAGRLNRPMPELGLPAGSLSAFQEQFLSPERDRELAALEAVGKKLNVSDAGSPAQRVIIDDLMLLHARGKGLGVLPAPREALTRLKTLDPFGFPVPAGVAEAPGASASQSRPLITNQQIAQMLPRLDPGDILLIRREGRLGNIGLPGYWTHAALYVGNPAERAGFFNESDAKAWVNAQGFDDFESMLRTMAPQAFQTDDGGTAPREAKLAARIIEATDAGVVLTPLETATAADSVAVLRPRLAKRDKACALLHAFQFIGRPYDRDFDFSSDAALVCSELVTRSFTADRGARGLHFELTTLLGHPVLPPNEIVRQFAASQDSPARQFELVLYLESRESEGRAVESGLPEFCKSWLRPKWQLVATSPQQQKTLAWKAKW